MQVVKKFQSKMLITNMLITSAVIIAAFVFIFWDTYRNVDAQIQSVFDGALMGNFVIESSGEELMGNVDSVGEVSAEVFTVTSTENRGVMFVAGDHPQLFTLALDEAGEIVDMPQDSGYVEGFFREAARIAMRDQDSNRDFALEGRRWRYRIMPLLEVTEEGERSGYTAMFLDIDAYAKTLRDLSMTLLLVGLGTLIAIYVVSVILARRAAKPLEQAWLKQRQFIADASHELKTPLSIVTANYDVLMTNRDETVESQIKWLDYMKIGMDRMSTLTQDLLTLARLDDAQVAVQRSRFDLSEAVREVALPMQPICMAKEINLSLNIADHIVITSAEQGIRQVVAILLDNAIKYTDQGGKIDVTLNGADNMIRLTVQNTGEGIAETDIEHIFDRFYKSDTVRHQGDRSYGLGLSIAKGIIDRADGSICAVSSGGVTTFSVSLRSE